MSTSFEFVFGMLAGDGVGRWIQGSVSEIPTGFRFRADLTLSFAMPSDWMLHRANFAPCRHRGLVALWFSKP